MARTLGKKVVLCDSYNATTGVAGGNVVTILLNDNESVPTTIAGAEALVEKRCVGAELTKARALIAAQKGR